MAKNPDGSFRNYMSTRKAASESAKKSIGELYAELLKIEKNEGFEASEAAFKKFLDDNGLSDSDAFNAYMKNLNK
jgi:predicted Zn-dependent peptidase